MEDLNILQVCTRDISGGAEKIAWNLFNAYRQRGLSSWLAVGYKESDLPHVLVIPNDEYRGKWAKLWVRIGEVFSPLLETIKANRLKGWTPMIGQPKRSINILLGREDFNFPGTWKLLEFTPKPPDILHCHNLHGDYFDPRALPWLSQQVPTVLTLHDAWLLSGHCAYSLDCIRWKSGCGKCPYLDLYPSIKRDATEYNWRRKRDIFAKSHLYVTTPSRWLMEKVEQSILEPATVESKVISNGVDLSIFKPRSKSKVRTDLNLPQSTAILLFIGNRFKTSQFKDYATIKETAKKLGDQNAIQKLLLLCVGDEGPDEQLGKIKIRFVGYQKDPGKIAQFYQAADIFLHAAKTEADTFPTTILEALACGTPVVATAVGGVPEQITDEVNGFLVPPGDNEAMALRIEQLLFDDELRARMGADAAKVAQCRYDFNRQVNEYLNWYHKILKDWQSRKEKTHALAKPN